MIDEPGAEPGPAAAARALAGFSPLVRDWFTATFAAPTPAQIGAWQAISSANHTLVIAPTGSGKTLAAFLSAIDELVAPRLPPTTYDASPVAGPDPEVATSDRHHRCRVLYISPLKALAVDIERNLRSPLTGIAALAAERGAVAPDIEVAVRSGDTPASARAAFARRGADILITTPESLFLLLTSKAREMLAGVRTVIVDEVHAVAGTKRGAHLAVSLDRLDAMTGRPAQRVGLSATVRPTEEVARFLAGGRPVTVVAPAAAKQVDIQVVVPVPDMGEIGASPRDLTGPAGASPARSSIWPHVEEKIVDLIEAHRSTIVFANSRRLAERLTARLNEIHVSRLDAAGEGGAVDAPVAPPGPLEPSAQIMAQSGSGSGAPPVIARAHHGSVSREQRADIEDALKAGRLPAVVATSSLELGIDMGAVDLVIQVESPPSVSSGLQRIGRAGHQVGVPSKGVLFPKFRGDLVSAAVAAERMRAGDIEQLRVVANPLDVAAQQIVSICAMEESVGVDELLALLRRSAPFSSLGRGALESVLDMLSGRYPSERFAELRPRLTWDRAADRLVARPGAQRLAVTSGGTIPDRGLYGVFLAGTGAAAVSGSAPDAGSGSAPDAGRGAASHAAADAGPGPAPDAAPGPAPVARSGSASAAAPGATPEAAVAPAAGQRRGGRRVGELDEEMVYESRVGDVFVLGSSSWRIVDIGRDRVEVVPAPGAPGRLPFWKADSAGRPAELGRAHGQFVRELVSAGQAQARERLVGIGLDTFAADNLLTYIAEQRDATGFVPDDVTLVVERFRDELGDWRVVIHSPYGAAVHAPWALVIAARMRERYGIDVQAQHSDDGIVLRLPDVEYDGGLPDLAGLIAADKQSIRAEVTEQLGGSAVFAARFRECAARSLLLPREQAGKRQPLWQQRQRAAQLLQVAAGFPEFPVVAEAARECLADVFDVASLADLMRRIAAREVHVVELTTPTPSPFARSLLFGYVAQFIYEGDSPLAERRAAALTIDPTLLAELLGTGQSPSLRDLLDAASIAAVEASLQRTAPDRRARNDDDIADLARILGPLTVDEIAQRCMTGGRAAVARLAAARRLIEVHIAGRQHWADPADAAVLRDGLGAALPSGLPDAFLQPADDPLGRLMGRYARTHGPFTALEAAARLGLGATVVRDVLARLVQDGRLSSGEFRPLGTLGAIDGRDEFVDVDVLRLLRRRSLATLRAEVEPVPPETLGRFLPAWHGIAASAGSTAPQPPSGGAVLRVVEQLAGAALPASALETLILPARIPGYAPSILDELTASGDVTWSVHGPIGDGDAWIALHTTETAPLTMPPRTADWQPQGAVHQAILEVLRGGGAYFFPALLQAVHGVLTQAPTADSAALNPVASAPGSGAHVLDALWDLVFAGMVTGDTLGPLRARLSAGHTAHRVRNRPPPARMRPSRLALLTGQPALGIGSRGGRAAAVPATAAGRWSLLPEPTLDPTVRLHAAAEVLLDRYGVVTRGSVAVEGTAGGFAGVYQVLSALEESGRIRRGYFVEGLGAAQFADVGAVDRLRSMAPKLGESAPRGPSQSDADAAPARFPGWPAESDSATGALVLACADPANPYGSALPWPEPVTSTADAERGSSDSGSEPGADARWGHRPSRRAGALVCLVDGAPVMFAERGGRSLLSFTTETGALHRAAGALAAVVSSGRLGAITVTTIDGHTVHGATGPAAAALRGAGFRVNPGGLRLRPGPTPFGGGHGVGSPGVAGREIGGSDRASR